MNFQYLIIPCMFLLSLCDGEQQIEDCKKFPTSAKNLDKAKTEGRWFIVYYGTTSKDEHVALCYYWDQHWDNKGAMYTTNYYKEPDNPKNETEVKAKYTPLPHAPTPEVYGITLAEEEGSKPSLDSTSQTIYVDDKIQIRWRQDCENHKKTGIFGVAYRDLKDVKKGDTDLEKLLDDLSKDVYGKSGVKLKYHEIPHKNCVYRKPKANPPN